MNLPPDTAAVQRWLLERLQESLGPGVSLDVHLPMAELGLDSRLAISISGQLEDWLDLGVDLEPTIFFDYPTIAELAAHIAELAAQDAEGRG